MIKIYMVLKRLNYRLLIVITLLIPINQILLNYLFSIDFSKAIAIESNYYINQTLIANLISIGIFSVLIFGLGKMTFSTIQINKTKIIQASKIILIIWLISQIITLIISYILTGDIKISKNFNVSTGALLGQFFGNAAFEEFIYRGIYFIQLYLILKTKLSDKSSIIYSVIISQVIFALIHIPNSLWIQHVDNLFADLLMKFIIGIILTLIFIRTSNLLLLIGIHSLINCPFNLIESKFPTEIVVLLISIIIALVWKKITPHNTGYTSCGFQNNLQVQSSLAKAVTGDSEVVTKSRTLHTLNR